VLLLSAQRSEREDSALVMPSRKFRWSWITYHAMAVRTDSDRLRVKLLISLALVLKTIILEMKRAKRFLLCVLFVILS
jgi:hypothetical protein